MLYCSHCGTQNRDGSKFCNNCGARLIAESGLRCPMCSTPNPVERVFCVSCGARLVPLTGASTEDAKQPQSPIKGLTLPSKSVGDEEPSTAPAGESAGGPAGPASSTSLEGPVSAEPPTDLERVPDWLERLRALPAVSEESPKEETPEEQEPAVAEPPRAAEPAAPAVAAPSAAEEPAADESSSHSTLIGEENPPPASIEQAPALIDQAPAVPIPDWLKAPPDEVAEETPASPPPETPVPDWLKTPQPEPEAPPIPPVDRRSELPPWLKDDEEEAEETEQPAEAEQSIDELLESLQEPAPKAAEAPKSLVGEMIESAEEDEVPEWLRNARPDMRPNVPQPERPTPDQVPEWVLKFKPSGITFPESTEPAEEPVETSGPLEGLRGVLPIALAITEPHPPGKDEATPNGADGGQIFETILATPAETNAPAAKAPRFVLTMRPLIYLLLGLAVLVPFFLPTDLASSSLGIANTPAAAVYDTLQKAAPDSTAVLAFDYDPSQAGEMDLLAGAVARDLVSRRVNIVAVSTAETGPQLAERVLSAAAANSSGSYAYGTNYAIVYLPGHDAGLASLAANGWAADTDFATGKPVAELPLAAQKTGLRDTALIVELAGSDQSLRWWMEQVQPHTNVPIVAAVSAGVEPNAKAYLQANQLKAEMGGMLSAAQYEVLSSQPGLAVISVNAQTAAQWVLVLVIVLGNVALWISRARGKSP